MPSKPKQIWRDLPTDFLDIGMEPLFKVRKRDDTIHYVSAADALWHKQFEDALAGDLASFRAVINMAKKNLRYTNLKRAYVSANALPSHAYNSTPNEGEKRADYFSRDAGTILDIMVQVKKPGDPEFMEWGMDLSEHYFFLQPWVLEAAAKRQASDGEPEDLSHYRWPPHWVVDLSTTPKSLGSLPLRRRRSGHRKRRVSRKAAAVIRAVVQRRCAPKRPSMSSSTRS